MIEFKMPSLGADMERGTVVGWHVQPGSNVKRGDVIVDVETDKGTIAVDVWDTGKISEILVPQGQTVAVGTPLVRIEALEEKGTPPGPDQTIPPRVPEPPTTMMPQAEVLPKSVEYPAKRRISPLARRVAKNLGVNLDLIPNTPDDRAIERRDVEAFARGEKREEQIPQESLTQKILPTFAEPPSETMRLRRVIADLMTRSKREIPHYYVESEINLERTMKWLERLNGIRSVQNRLLPIVPVLKAVGRAAKEIHGINGLYENSIYIPKDEVSLGIVLALRTGGIVNPAIHGITALPLDDIMKNLMDLIQRARHGKLKSSEISGQTLTVTSLGDLGADKVTGVIYPPQVAILGIGRIRWRPWAEENMLGSARTVHVSLAADHRVSDGLTGAAFLGMVDRLLQEPDKL